MRIFHDGRLENTFDFTYAYVVRNDSLFTGAAGGPADNYTGTRFNRGKLELSGSRLSITYPWFGPADESITVTQVFFPHNSTGGVGRVPYTRTKWNAADWGPWIRFVPDASDTFPGLVQRATTAEAQAMANTTKFITPATLGATLGDDTGWVSVPVASPFTPNPTIPLQARRRRGEVFLRGRVEGSPAAGTTIATLPAGFRPPTTMLLPGTRTSVANNPTPMVRVDVTTTGDLIVYYGTVTTAPVWIGVYASFLID